MDVISHSAYLVWESASPVPDDYKQRLSGGNYANVSYDSSNITALLRMMKERDTILDATVMIFLNMSTTTTSTNAGLMGEWAANVTRLAHREGVRIVAGTDDMGDPYDDDDALPLVHREMAALVGRCGLSPYEALKAATLHAAQALGIQSQFGTIEE